MFELVDRCEDYPAFCRGAARRSFKFRDATKTVATLHINFPRREIEFTTEKLRISIVDENSFS